jgi:hypothetical protein
MATEAQTAANQQNAKLSTGPRTPEGKRRSSINNLTYGLFANDIREHCSPEDQIRYDAFIKLHTHSFTPKGPRENWLAYKIAQTMFLLDRAYDLNLHMLCKPVNAEGPHAIGQASAEPLPNMALYKNRMRNDFEHYSALLKVEQAERKEKEEKEMHKGDIIAQACALTQTKFDPAAIGFEFSKKDHLKVFLLRKLMMNAYAVMQAEIPNDDTKSAFIGRLQSLAKLIAMV